MSKKSRAIAVVIATIPALALIGAGASCRRTESGADAGPRAEPMPSTAPIESLVDRGTLPPAFPSSLPEASAEAATSSSAAPVDAGAVEDKGPVRIGAMTVSGSLSPEVIGRTLRGAMPKVRQCYDKAEAKAAGTKGQLKVRLAIDREGNVATAGNGGTDLGSDELVDCVLRAFWSMKFPKPKDGIVLVVVPLKFGVK